MSSLLVLSYEDFREPLDKMCRCDGMVDVADSKSAGGDTVWVRVPPPAPIKRGHPRGCALLIGASLICSANRPPAAGLIEKQGKQVMRRQWRKK